MTSSSQQNQARYLLPQHQRMLDDGPSVGLMNAPAERFDWSRLNHLQIGRYAEYFVKMEFTLYGFDVYTAEVDYHGIDFAVRRDPTRYYDVQVKSVRNLNYTLFTK